jgi:hypothetical protein
MELTFALGFVLFALNLLIELFTRNGLRSKDLVLRQQFYLKLLKLLTLTMGKANL